MRSVEDYRSMIPNVSILPEWVDRYRRKAEQLESLKSNYTGMGVDWRVLAVIHMRECNNDFDRQILNGEKITEVTKLVPKGRGPWSSWKASTLEAIKEHNIPIGTEPAVILQFLEDWNGWGYFNRGLQSPYLWSGSNYGKDVGKYVADGKYNPNAVDQQLGAGAMYLQLSGNVSAVQRGSTGKAAYDLQSFLNLFGHNLVTDGQIGDKTATAFLEVFGVRMKGDNR